MLINGMQKHPTGLHGFKPKKERVKQDCANDDNYMQISTTYKGVQFLSCASTKFRSDVISMCAVPVQIRHPYSNKVLHAYAILGNFSPDTFVKQKVIETLGITGVDTRVTVKTLNVKISHMTTVVKNLKVVGSLAKPKWIKPPRAYTKQELPVDEQEIATPEIGGIISKELQIKFTQLISLWNC